MHLCKKLFKYDAEKLADRTSKGISFHGIRCDTDFEECLLRELVFVMQELYPSLPISSVLFLEEKDSQQVDSTKV